MTPRFQRVAVVGIGLIGGSLARDLRLSGAVGEVVGVEPDPAVLERALERGLIDRGESDPLAGVRGAEVVVIAVPVGSFSAVLRSLLEGLDDSAVVTDVGSVKATIQAEAEALMGAGSAFVGGHPIAGTEDSGVEAGREGLFRGALCVLTPTGETPEWALDRVRALWRELGARVVTMAPNAHDRALAATSHLPHMLAYGLIRTLGELPEEAGVEQFAAGGFRDLTRIAGSDAVMWRDIALANRSALLGALDRFQGQLGRLREAIEAGDAETLEGLLREGRELRRGLPDNTDLHEENDDGGA